MVASIAAGAVSGASSAALLGVINAALRRNGRAGSVLIAAFVGLCILLPASRYISELLLNILGQDALYSLRMQLSRQILAVPLRRLEQLGSSRLFTMLTDDVPAIAETVFVVPLLCINGTVVVGCLLYMTVLSPALALIVAAFIFLGILVYQLPAARGQKKLRKARHEADSIMEHLRALTHGTKELKIHRARRHAFINDLLGVAVDAYRHHSVAGMKLYTAAASLGQTLVFAVIGVVVFVLPSVLHTDGLALTGYTIALLYLMTPLQVLMNSVRILGRANVALDKVKELGLYLTEQQAEDVSHLETLDQNWSRLEFCSTLHAYHREGEDSVFVLGPINLKFNSGELVFITGANGSGKTTFAKLLTGLYRPEEGEIRLDGQPITTPEQMEAYRQFFTIIFSDFYLFDRLLGLSGDPELDGRATTYLNELKLAHSIQVASGRFSSLDLSQGQRKRMALLTAYLEDRPIYVFDEWAADQDPYFREMFYTQILRELKMRKKTIFVITHDDRYYHVADRIIKLEEGRVITDCRKAEPEMATQQSTPPRLHLAETSQNGGMQESSDKPASQDFSPTRRAVLFSLQVWCFFAVAALWALKGLRPPAAVPASALPQNFSAERALAHVRMIAQRPHPMGSEANQAVRQYLLTQLSALGVLPDLFSGLGISSRPGFLVAGKTEDIVARLPGTANSRAVMLIAHYDSVYRAPGAGDDGAGVAAILEAVRALRAGSALKNDVIILFTDGEEAGLLGADAFAVSHPWMKDVGIILNFEGRGDRGPSLLFETSLNNGPLIEGVANSASHPIGSSLFYSLYKLLPNDTDFTVFRRYQVPGLNFAFGENLEAYHSRLDTVDNLSLGSLQHHGSYVLDLARYFGQMDLTALRRPVGDDVFFNLSKGVFISYRQAWVLPLQVLATVLVFMACFLIARRGEIRWQRLLLAALSSIATLLAIPAVLFVATSLLMRLLAGHLIIGDSPANAWLLTGAVLLGFCTGSFFLSLFRKYFTVLELSLAGLLVVTILNWPVALLLPGGSYLLLWPLLIMTVAVLAVVLTQKTIHLHTLSFAVLPGTLVTCLLFAPIIYLLYVFLTLQPITLTADGAVIALFFLFCAPVLDMAIPSRRWGMTMLILFISAAASLGIGIKSSHSSPEHPRRDSILYSLNAGDHTAAWISFDRSPDSWTAQFFSRRQPTLQPMPDYLAGMQRPVLSTPAPALPLLPPLADIKVDENQNEVRRLHIDVKSQTDVRALFLTFSPQVQSLSIRIGGREITPSRGSGTFTLALFGMGRDHTILELAVKASAGANFWLSSQSVGLPVTVRPRPDDFMAGEGSDVTMTSQKYSF
jgi:putative ATP-binding cassette transporter